MCNTTPCSHPIHFARTNHLLHAQTIPVCYLSSKKITYSRKPDMWMWQYIKGCMVGRYIHNGSCMIHKDKRSYHSAKTEGKNAFNFHEFTDCRSAGFNYNIEHNLMVFLLMM